MKRNRKDLERLLKRAVKAGPKALAELRAELELGQRTALVFGESVDTGKRTAVLTVVTEKPVPMIDWDRMEVVDEVLAMGGFKLPEGRTSVPMLDTHSRESIDDVLGRIEGIKVVGDRLDGTAYFTEGDDAADRALNKVARRVVTDVSGGYQVTKRIFVGEGAELEVMGKVRKGPVNVATEWILKEGSLCPIGADEGAGVRSRASPGWDWAEGDDGTARAEGLVPQSTKEGHTAMNRAELMKALERALKEGKMDEVRELKDKLDALNILDAAKRMDESEKVIAAAAAAPKPEKPAEGERKGAEIVDLEKEKKNWKAEDKKRAEEIRQYGEAMGIDAERITKAIDEDVAPDAARAAFLKDYQERNKLQPTGSPRVEVGDDKARSARIEAISDAMFLANTERKFKIEKPHELTGKFRRFRLQATLRHLLECNGVRTSDMTLDEIMGCYSQTNPGQRGYVPQAAADFVKITRNVMHKTALEGWIQAPVVWKDLATVIESNDFKPTPLYKRGQISRLPRINREGKVPQVKYLDGTYEELSLNTYGGIIALTWKAMYNDDLGFLNNMPAEMSEAAAFSIEDEFILGIQGTTGYGLTMDGDAKTLFHADHNNYLSGLGVGGVPSVSTLNLMDNAIGTQTGPNGKPLGLELNWILSPRKLKGTVMELLTSETPPGTANYGNVKNIWQNKLRPYFSQRLDLGVTIDTEVEDAPIKTTGNTKAWYSGTDRATNIAVGFLAGRREPQIDMENPIDVLGSVWRVHIDAGVKAGDYRGMVMNKGET